MRLLKETIIQIMKDILINFFVSFFALYFFKIPIPTVGIFFIFLLNVNFFKTLLIRFVGESTKLKPAQETNIHVVTDILIVICAGVIGHNNYNIPIHQCIILILIGQVLNWSITYAIRKWFFHVK